MGDLRGIESKYLRMKAPTQKLTFEQAVALHNERLRKTPPRPTPEQVRAVRSLLGVVKPGAAQQRRSA